MRIWQLSLYGIAAAGISTAAAADIPAGTTETGGSVSRGDVQNVFGTAVDFAVHGTQNIMSGGESQLKPAEFQLKHRYLTMRYRRSAEGPSRR